MPFITQGKANLKYILIVVVLAAIAGGGILVWQPWRAPKSEEILYCPSIGRVEKEIISGVYLRRCEESKGMYGDKYFLVINGEIGKLYDWIDDPIVSPDGKQIAYRALTRKQHFIVVGNREMKGYNDVTNPIWSSDSKEIAYAANQGMKWFLVRGEQESQKTYNFIWNIKFSPDNKIVAYAAEDGDRRRRLVVIDVKEGKGYGWIPGGPVFSPDGNKIAYVAASIEEYSYESPHFEFVVINDIDGRTLKESSKIYESITNLEFTPDGKKMTYSVIEDLKMGWVEVIEEIE
jgi:hypothetical protein